MQLGELKQEVEEHDLLAAAAAERAAAAEADARRLAADAAKLCAEVPALQATVKGLRDDLNFQQSTTAGTEASLEELRRQVRNPMCKP